MQPDIRRLLQTEAPTPSGSLDLDDVRARSARVARHRWFLFVTGALLVVVATPAVALQVFQSEKSTSPTPGDSPTESCAPYGYEADINVYLHDESTLQETAALAAQIEALEQVAAVYYITSEEILREFSNIFRDEPQLFENLGPNALPAMLRVVLHNPDDAEAVAKSLPESKAVDEIRSGRPSRASIDEWLQGDSRAAPPTICTRATDPNNT